MPKSDTSRHLAFVNQPIVSGDCLYFGRVRPVKRLDGSRTKARTWEVAWRRPRQTYLGCGTAASKEAAKAAIAELIAAHGDFADRAVANREKRRCRGVLRTSSLEESRSVTMPLAP